MTARKSKAVAYRLEEVIAPAPAPTVARPSIELETRAILRDRESKRKTRCRVLLEYTDACPSAGVLVVKLVDDKGHGVGGSWYLSTLLGVGDDDDPDSDYSVSKTIALWLDIGPDFVNVRAVVRDAVLTLQTLAARQIVALGAKGN